MKHVKSERLKKLEVELSDLEQWLKLGLVPKKDLDKHKEEIVGVRAKIEEEKERLQFLKESGEVEEYITPKKMPNRTGYNEMPTIPDIDIGETMGAADTGFDMESEVVEVDHTSDDRDDDDEEGTEEAPEKDEEEEDESYFSDRNRWRRGGIIDPDANDW
jgi:poly-D-alanine transfer protein DltD